MLCGSLKKGLEQYQRSTETSTHAQSTQGAPPLAGRKNFCLKMREGRTLCEGQFIIIWTPAGHQHWTLNKLCQDICSKLASLAALHKQKSAGVQHVEQLPNRVINLYKQKNLPSKHISSHCTPGYKPKPSRKLMHIPCLLESQRKAQAAYSGKHGKLRMCTLGEEQCNGEDLFSHYDDDVVLFLLWQHAKSSETVKSWNGLVLET